MSTKCIVITGASDGIGKALAWEMAARGYNLGLTARRIELLEILKDDIQEKYPAITVFVDAMDVIQYDQQEAVFDGLHQQLGKIDILVASSEV